MWADQYLKRRFEEGKLEGRKAVAKWLIGLPEEERLEAVERLVADHDATNT